MLKKKIVVYLNSGICKEHEIEVKDEETYQKWVARWAKGLMSGSRNILTLSTPSCNYLYKADNVVAVGFEDLSPLPERKTSLGFETPSSKNERV